MASKTVTEFKDLTTCLLCRETFTKPKMLPCQHSYCYDCLVLLEKDKLSTITCPCCKEEHKIPASGISGFKDNLLLKHLISKTLSKAEECSDCKKRPSVDDCEHCQQRICSRCLVEHAKLSTEINVTLKQLKDSLNTSNSQNEGIALETSRTNLENERRKMNELCRNDAAKKLTEVKVLMERATFTDNLMGVITELYEILGSVENKEAKVDAYINELVRNSNECTTSDSLNDLKNKLTDLKTFLGLIETQNEEFRLKNDLATDKGYELIQFGQVIVNVRGKYAAENIMDQITQLVHVSAETMPKSCHLGVDREDLLPMAPAMTVDAETQTVNILNSDLSDEQGVCANGHGRAVWHVNISPEVQTPEIPKRHKDSDAAVKANWPVMKTFAQELTLPTVRKYNLQNQLPTNVNYTDKGHRSDVVVMGESFDGSRLLNPRGCAYHVGRYEIIVADGRNRRIMAYSAASKRNARVFYSDSGDHEFWDVAVSSDSEHVYIAAGRCLIKVNQYGRLEKTISSFLLGFFKSCRLVTCFQEYTVVVDGKHQCVVVFYNDRDEELRCIGKGHLKDPTAVAISNERKFYVADWVASCVRVFDWTGAYLETFTVAGPGVDSGYIWGIAVDGDGNVCVSRPDSHRIEVYDPRRKLITSISGPGKEPGKVNYPFGLCLTTGGRLIVTDSGNHRVQLF